MENKIRNTLNEIYFGKTRDIVNGLRSVEPLSDANKKQALQVGQLGRNLRRTWYINIVFLQDEIVRKLHQKNSGQN